MAKNHSSFIFLVIFLFLQNNQIQQMIHASSEDTINRLVLLEKHLQQTVDLERAKKLTELLPNLSPSLTTASITAPHSRPASPHASDEEEEPKSKRSRNARSSKRRGNIKTRNKSPVSRDSWENSELPNEYGKIQSAAVQASTPNFLPLFFKFCCSAKEKTCRFR